MITETQATWADVVEKTLVVSRMTHLMGSSSCFGHMANDVADERYCPEGIAGAVQIAQGLTRVFARYIDPRHMLDFPLPSRKLSAAWFVVVGQTTQAGPFKTRRGAMQAARIRNLDGKPMRLEETKEQYVSRVMDIVDRALTLESAWRDATDCLESYSGIPDRFEMIRNKTRWYDVSHQSKRRAEKLRSIEKQIPEARYVE